MKWITKEGMHPGLAFLLIVVFCAVVIVAGWFSFGKEEHAERDTRIAYCKARCKPYAYVYRMQPDCFCDLTMKEPR